MGKNSIGALLKIAAAVVALAAAVVVIVVYSNEIISFLTRSKEKVSSKLCPLKKHCIDDEFSDYADI